MEHLFQDIIAIAMLAGFGAPLLCALAGFIKTAKREGIAFERGFQLGLAGIRMNDYPDSLAGYCMYQGNLLFFGKITPEQCGQDKRKAQQLLASLSAAAS